MRAVGDDAAALWLCFADQGEADLAREAWPGTLYGAATQTYISAAVKALGREPLMPMGSSALAVAGALGSLFGRQDNPRLADPRLEALRRTAVLAWHRGAKALSDAEKEAFTAAGFTPGQYRTLLASIGAARLNKGRYA
jgi:hypothetical protein